MAIADPTERLYADEAEGSDDPDSLAYRGADLPDRRSGCFGCGVPDDCVCPDPSEYS